MECGIPTGNAGMQPGLCWGFHTDSAPAPAATVGTFQGERERNGNSEHFQVGMQGSVAHAGAPRAWPWERSIYPEQPPEPVPCVPPWEVWGCRARAGRGDAPFLGMWQRCHGLGQSLCVCADGLGLRCGMSGVGVWRGLGR